MEAYGANSNNNKWIHQDLSEILIIEHMSERNWIRGLTSVIVLQVCEREDYIFIRQSVKSMLFAC